MTPLHSSERDDQAAIRQFLEGHKTDDVHFRDGYENRRINVTLLYGRRLDASST